MFRTNNLFCRIIFILTILSLVSFLIQCSREKEKSYSEISRDLAGSPTARDSLVIELDGIDSMSVFDLLVEKHDVKFKATLQGVFVTAIDSIKGGEGYFWIYLVNDSAAQKACDKYLTKNGDKIKWLLRKS